MVTVEGNSLDRGRRLPARPPETRASVAAMLGVDVARSAGRFKVTGREFPDARPLIQRCPAGSAKAKNGAVSFAFKGYGKSGGGVRPSLA